MRFNMKLLKRVAATAILIVGTMPHGLRAQASPQVAGLKALIGIRTMPTRPTTSGRERNVGDDMLAGESARLGVAVGNGDDLCHNSGWAGPKSGILSPAMQDMVNKQEATAQYMLAFRRADARSNDRQDQIRSHMATHVSHNAR